MRNHANLPLRACPPRNNKGSPSFMRLMSSNRAWTYRKELLLGACIALSGAFLLLTSFPHSHSAVLFSKDTALRIESNRRFFEKLSVRQDHLFVCIHRLELFLPHDFPDEHLNSTSIIIPSISRFKGRLILAVTVFNQRTIWTQFSTPYKVAVGFVWLNEKFEPLGPLELLSRPGCTSFVSCYFDFGSDVRSIVAGDELFIITDYRDQMETIRLRWTKVHMPNDFTFQLRPFFDSDVIIDIDSAHKAASQNQKNWTPFFLDSVLYFVFSVIPEHRVLKPDYEGFGVQVETTACTRTNFQWPYGEVRGSTQAVLIKEGFLTFFHSSTRNSFHANNVSYFTGAYVFSARPPFQILLITPSPLTHSSFYGHDNLAYLYWAPPGYFDYIIAPYGLIVEDGEILLSFGNNLDNFVARLDQQAFINSMVSVSQSGSCKQQW